MALSLFRGNHNANRATHMRSLSLCLRISAAALLAGCGGSQPPIGASGAMPQTSAIETHAERGESWMMPEARQDTLLYISTETAGVYVFDYPSRRVVGILTDASSPEGLCSDAAGNVFVTDSYGRQLLEYAHGGSSPIRTLKGAASPIDCAVDRKTGNLAVASETSAVYMFPKGRRWPKYRVNDPSANFWFCTYDLQGNLFASDDSVQYDESFISELPQGSSTFTNFELNEPIENLGGIQSHDGYLTVGDGGDNNIYQVRISHSIAKIVRTTPLVGAADTAQFTFYGDKLISPDPASDFAGVWNYPAGGKPVRKVDGIPGGPFGSTISEP
jgi:hypothetical protein